ncbi:MAG: thiamine pyrophosphate-binding protein [Proteobacteria bacterium]|jgi:acetolactate synthase-1/2/3 large subunit|nr:thiamine pyrophosphate-binding protein [Pseudomonadota bacterium]
MITVSDYIAEYLKQAGITHVFMITGGGAMYLNNSFGKYFKPICFHNEQGCTIAAEGYARIHNKIPVVNVTTGPGGSNAITGVLGAWTDSIPMLVISGQVKYNQTARYAKSLGINLRQLGDQEYDIVSMVSHITKYAEMVIDPYSIKYHLDKALHLARTGRPGPCWLDIPLDVQNAKIDEDKLSAYIGHVSSFPKIDKPTITRVLDCVKKAKRPVILAGPGIHFSGSIDVFHQLIEKFNIPILTAFNAHDLLEHDHPLRVGRPGTIGERGGNFILQNADLLLVLGCRLDIRQIGYKWEAFAEKSTKIVVDIDEAELKKPTIFPDIPIHGDVKDFMEQMLCEECNIDRTEWIEWCKEKSKKYPVVLPEHRQVLTLRSKLPLVNPYGFMEEVGKQLPENQIMVCGNATACIIPFQVIPMKKGQRMFSNSGMAAMGWDISAAIGAHFASGQKIVCFAGDGSIQMNIQELQTIRHHNLPIKIFLLNNGGYHSIRQTQTNNNFNPVGFDNTNGISFPCMEKIAYAYGIRYLKCDNYPTIKETVAATLCEDDPVICEIVLDERQPFSPKIAARKAEDGSMIACSLEDMWPFLDQKELKENMVK